MPSFEEFCTITATMVPERVGQTPSGTRIDFPFKGTATSPHWEGTRPVRGVDYATVRDDGHLQLDIRGSIGEGDETVSYRATGLALVRTETASSPQELITFQTASEQLRWLNDVIAVGLGSRDSGEKAITIYIIRR